MVFSASDLANMQSVQVEHMQDTCVIGVYSTTFDSNGAPTPTYTFNTITQCGLKMNTARENHRADMTVTQIDATVRLPIGTSIKSTDQVKITYRFGVAVTNIVFEVVGEIRRGPSGLQVDLLQVKP